MIMTGDLAPFAGTVGGGFCIGFITGYAIKKAIKLAAVIVGLFIAALTYLQYRRFLNKSMDICVLNQNNLFLFLIIANLVCVINPNNLAGSIFVHTF
jgi:uncharacterized membrane protein (Fun14 family)